VIRHSFKPFQLIFTIVTFESSQLNFIKKLKVSGEGSRPPSVSGSIQLMHPTRRSLGNHPGCAGLLRWGVAVSPNPRECHWRTDHPCYRDCVVSEPLPELSPGRISRPICPVEEGSSSAGLNLPSAALPLLIKEH